MRRIVFGFLITFLVIFLASSFLSPWVYWVVEEIAGGRERLFPFHRIFHRTLMLSAVACAFWLYRFWRIRGLTQLGLVDRAWLKRLSYGLIMGLGTMGILAWLEMSFGWRRLYFPQNTPWIRLLLSIVATGFVVAIVEEILFRGLLFYALRPAMGRYFAFWAIIMAALFASVHFLRSPGLPGTVDWRSGLETWGDMFAHARPFAAWAPAWVGLFLAGLFLSAVVYKTKSLWEAIGWHAGWVIVLKSYACWTEELPFYSRWTQELPGATRNWLSPGDQLYNGHTGFMLLSLLIVWAIWMRRPANEIKV